MLINRQRMTGTVANPEVDAVKAPSISPEGGGNGEDQSEKNYKVKYVFN